MLTVSDVISRLTENLRQIDKTVDTLKAGQTAMEVKGIAAAFMPSYDVLSQAAKRGLNMVVAHEAPFYQHMDIVDFLVNDPVYQAKKAFIDESEFAIFRLHDHMHRSDPDQIVEGLVRDLEWSAYTVEPKASGLLPLRTYPLSIPTMSVREVANYVKKKLDVSFVRVVGNLSMPCSRVGILPGYCGGGALAIPFFQYEDLDLIITGEGPEWETPEYVRDAVALGQHKALIILGHNNSEASGMKYLAESMRTMFPAIPVEFIAEEQPFQVI